MCYVLWQTAFTSPAQGHSAQDFPFVTRSRTETQTVIVRVESHIDFNDYQLAMSAGTPTNPGRYPCTDPSFSQETDVSHLNGVRVMSCTKSLIFCVGISDTSFLFSPLYVPPPLCLCDADSGIRRCSVHSHRERAPVITCLLLRVITRPSLPNHVIRFRIPKCRASREYRAVRSLLPIQLPSVRRPVKARV